MDGVSKGCQGQLSTLSCCQSLQAPLRCPPLPIADSLPQPPALTHSQTFSDVVQGNADLCGVDITQIVHQQVPAQEKDQGKRYNMCSFLPDLSRPAAGLTLKNDVWTQGLFIAQATQG